MKHVIVPIMLMISSTFMAFAWIGHIRFRKHGFHLALIASWLLVLPEYILNVSAFRYGHSVYSGAEMASINLCTGVLCVALVSRWFLKEPLTSKQIAGFFLMALAIVLIVYE